MPEALLDALDGPEDSRSVDAQAAPGLRKRAGPHKGQNDFKFRGAKFVLHFRIFRLRPRLFTLRLFNVDYKPIRI